MRRGEALGLRWEDVDLDGGYLQVVNSLVRTRERGLILQPPKTASRCWRIDLDTRTVRVLRRHRVAQRKIELELGPFYHDQGIVFANGGGGWMNPGLLGRTVRTLGQRVGYEGLTVRSLRHFHASVVLQEGENIVVVSKRLGHANVSITTDIYAHALPGWQRQAADRFAAAMEGG